MAAAAELDYFEAECGKRFPAIGQAWRRAWEYAAPLFAFPPAIRKSAQDHQDAAPKLLFLAIRNAVKWRRQVEWTAAVGQFATQFGDRFERSAC
jgi:putative transposase